PPTAAGAQTAGAALDAWWSIEVALSALDRLEVRGRDSAGLHLLLAGHGLDLASPELGALLGARLADPLFTSLAARPAGGCLSLVYKAAAEIGELGDNVAALRAAIATDPLLGMAMRSPSLRVTVLGHTRWASVGVISQANAHPLNSEEVGRPDGPYVAAALNGDVDNHVELRLSEALQLPSEVTTDAKVIPTLVSRRLAEGAPVSEAFRSSVARFEGSVAVAATAAAAPDEIHLALRGSGQSLNIGLAEDAFVVASEPYGLVEETSAYLRMDGEETRGQVVALRRDRAGSLAGVERSRYDGAPLPVRAGETRTAEVTTRDIDRGRYPHFLLKEVSEAPQSVRKTLRGKVVDEDGRLSVHLGDGTLPASLRHALAGGRVRRVLVIGQGTAAVAGQGVAAAIARCLPTMAVAAVPATELSGFGLVDDMSDTLVVAISQSGTTTDTNRTVDLVRSRGAQVVAVVNRRNSDLVHKAHGVLYTSDGRDVEMSVASTKAFYAQVAAGWILAVGLAAAAGCAQAGRDGRLLAALRDLPAAMEGVLAGRERIAAVAAALAPSRRNWAVVGSGPDRVAAAEARIKLSELCYKAIACDATEDKKHIDLSSEPLVIVCAAGLGGANADDVAKEVAIYRAHKAAAVVIGPPGAAARFAAATEVMEVPACDPDLAFVLSAMVAHLFGYEAALAIDAQARPLRRARSAIEALGRAPLGAPSLAADQEWLGRLGGVLAREMAPWLDSLRRGECNGHLEAATAVRIVSLLRYATAATPLDSYEMEFGKVASPAAVIGDLLEALSTGIDELTRPVDAIKHQAKTVTVGISRSEDELLAVPLVKETLAAGAGAEGLGYRAMRALAALDPAVAEVLGYTRYRIAGGTEIHVVGRGGVARGLVSRTDADPRLRGTKHRAAEERQVTVARGRRDGRTVVLVPEVGEGEVVGMTLLHVRCLDRLPPAQARAVLAGYRDRYSALADAVAETEPSFDDDRLGREAMVDLLTEPVYVLADRWRADAP
ncbi:MAG: SIS domain-containing protein, partial [Acidimicrobiales bacterium]